MSAPILKSLGIASVLGLWLSCCHDLYGQPPSVPKGIEVQARGPVHEAFATPTAEPQATQLLTKKPPLPLEEMPPEERPEGDVVWISGYWAWDDDRSDYLWVSGCWRTKPPGREWVPGYWREQGERWQWVPGFWTETAAVQEEKAKDVTYYPAPPAPPQTVPPGPKPGPDTFWVPGYHVWNGQTYAWRAGYWARVQPGYVWVPAHYRWSPYGYVFIPGYWDLAVSRRGILYAPVVVDPVVVGPTFVYTPAYAVSDTVVLDTLFVRPCYCHYYFGDYYGPRYRDYGFESCVVYSQRNYDSIIVYRSWEYRDDPRWVNVQINVFNDRFAGRAPVPPRTLVQQNTIINQTVINNNTTIVNNNINNTNINNVNVNNRMQVLAPTAQVAKAQGLKTMPMDPGVRQQAALQARTVQQAAVQQRQQTESALKASPPTNGPRTASLRVPAARTVSALPAMNPSSRPNPPTAGTAHAPQTGGTTPPGHTAGVQQPQQGVAGHVPQTGGQTAGAIKPAQPGQMHSTFGTTPPATGVQHPQAAGQKPATRVGQVQPMQVPAYNPTTLRAPSYNAAPGQANSLQRPQTFQGGPPPGNSMQPRPPYGAAAGNPAPNGQRPPVGMAPPGAQRPAPTVGPRPQPRPAPPPQRRPADDKKQHQN